MLFRSLYLATLHEIVTDETVEERNNNINVYLNELRQAVSSGDSVVVQRIVVTTVETITTWLDTIEYRIYMNRQQTGDGPSKERVNELDNLKEEIYNVETNIGNLQSEFGNANNLCNEEDWERIHSYIASLREQVKIIDEVTEEHVQLAVNDLNRWEEFAASVFNLNKQIVTVKQDCQSLSQSDVSLQTKLQELEKLEELNKCYMIKSVHLIAVARGLVRDFPKKELPKEVSANHELTKQIEYVIKTEQEKTLQLVSLAEEYDQTLKEFKKIIEIAEELVENKVSVNNLEHLKEEMQNHRKFFVNLSHCRAILESLEENLDSQTRNLHSELHQNLYQSASGILDKAAVRFQQMSSAATKWAVLEQSMRDEQRWLQVAQQRVPDLSSVTSADYDQYINLYQSLSLDISNHHTKLMHLNSVAYKLKEVVICSCLDEICVEPLKIIDALQKDVNGNLKQLLSFRESWTTYILLNDSMELWLKDAEKTLDKIEFPLGSEVPPPGTMRQFWVSFEFFLLVHQSFICISICRN